MTRYVHMIALCVALLGVGCGDDEETAGEGTTAGGGETTAGGEQPGGMTAPPGSQQPDEGGWDGDTAGGGGAGQPGGETGGQANGTTGGGEQESPWGRPEGETGRPLPPRRPMSSSARNAYQQGLNAAQAGNIAAARSAFQQALSADSHAYQAAYNLGVLADRSGNTTQALEYYRRALQIQPDYEKAAEGIVTIYLRRGSAPDAIAFIEPLARNWVRNLYLQAIYAETLVAANRLDDAWSAARAALRRDERFVPAMIALIKASLKQGREELAEGILDQALAIDDDNAELHYLKAEMLLEEDGRLREAMQQLRRAVELRPDYVEAQMALGIQLMEGANYTEALQHFQIASRLAPTLVAVQLNLADAYRANRQWAQAKQTFDHALEMQSSLPQAHYNMGLMYMTAGEDFPGLSKLQALQKAVQELTQYRNEMGPRLPRDDPSETYLEDLNRQIEREQTRLERERARAAREAESGGDSGGDSGADSGGGGE